MFELSLLQINGAASSYKGQHKGTTMSNPSDDQFRGQSIPLAAKTENAKKQLQDLYRKVGNRAVAAALSIRSSYTSSHSANILAPVTSLPVGGKRLPNGM